MQNTEIARIKERAAKVEDVIKNPASQVEILDVVAWYNTDVPRLLAYIESLDLALEAYESGRWS